jgi:hypothetical protein
MMTDLYYITKFVTIFCKTCPSGGGGGGGGGGGKPKTDFDQQGAGVWGGGEGGSQITKIQLMLWIARGQYEEEKFQISFPDKGKAHVPFFYPTDFLIPIYF